MPCNIPAKSEDVIYTVAEAWYHVKYAHFTAENTIGHTHFAFTKNRYNSTNCLTKWMAHFCRTESFIFCYMSHKSASVNTAVNSTNISLMKKWTCTILNNSKIWITNLALEAETTISYLPQTSILHEMSSG